MIVRSLGAGGAERQLIEFLRAADKSRLDFIVATMYRGVWHEQLEGSAGLTLRSLEKRSRYDLVGPISRLLHVAAEYNPDVVYGYMSTANMLATLAGYATRSRVIWGVRNSSIPASEDTMLGKIVHSINCRTSHRANAIIANSKAGREFYCRQGYRSDRFLVIRNGIDVNRFRRLEGAAREFRQLHGVKDEDFLLGLIGRIDPGKGHEEALSAVSELPSHGDRVKLCFAGAGVGDFVAKLQARAADLRISDRVIWLGHVEDIAPVYSAIDTCVLPSRGEGFPNSLAEAMACETPCIATDVGDVAELIGDTGYVIRECSAASLAQAVIWCRSRDLRELGARARHRIVENFSVSRMVEETTRLLESVGDQANALPAATRQR